MHAFDVDVTEEDVAFYQENGYWVAPKLFDEQQVAQFREHHAKVVAADYETRSVPPGRIGYEPGPIDSLVKIDYAYWADSTLAKLVLNPAIGKIAARLAGVDAVRLWHDQLLHKPPQQGSSANAVGWHQDYYYWQCSDAQHMLTAWVALVDVDEHNGCMEVVPGSHKWGMLDESDFFSQDLQTLQRKIEQVSGRPFETVPLRLPAGAVSFHHCLTIHGSRPNRSDAPRVSMVVHMMPDGTRYVAGTPSDPHYNVGLLSGSDGDYFAGPYFPVIYDRYDMRNPWQTRNGEGITSENAATFAHHRA